MKMNLFDMVDDILSDMDSDSVNSISDSSEALQVAKILKSVYFEMVSRKDWAHLRKTLALDNSADPDLPNRLGLPESLYKMEYVAYNRKLAEADADDMVELQYMYPDDFIEYTNNRRSDASNVQTVVVEGIKLYIINDKAPTYYTSFDDEFIYTDSWASQWTDTLLGGESQAIVYIIPTWTMEDEFVPDFPAEVFPTYLAEAKSTAFSRIKDSDDAKSEQQARRGNTAMAQRGWSVKGGIRYPNYGRRSRKGGYNQGHGNGDYYVRGS